MATTHDTQNQHAVETLNSLLRGEIAAAETYQQSLKKVGDEPGAQDLKRIHQEHVDACNHLRLHVRRFGGQPDQGSGTWGAFAKTVEGTAKLFGNKAALKALKEGEEQGSRSYEDAIQDAEMPMECRTLITTTLLPQTRAHVTILDRFVDTK